MEVHTNNNKTLVRFGRALKTTKEPVMRSKEGTSSMLVFVLWKLWVTSLLQSLLFTSSSANKLGGVMVAIGGWWNRDDGEVQRRFRGENWRQKREVTKNGRKVKAEEEAWCAWECVGMKDATVHCVNVVMAFIWHLSLPSETKKE